MSHVATNWAFAQRGLKPAEKLVLLCLADRHNPDRGGCWPSQDRLAADANISVSSLNNQLKNLEGAGLIRRERRFDDGKKRQMSTFYILGFEDGFSPDEEKLSPKIGDGAVSKSDEKPSPKNGQSSLQNLETNLVREPLRRTSKAQARESAPALGVDEKFDLFCKGHPHAVERDVIWREWHEALALGANPARLVVLANRYAASPEVQRGFPKKAQNWLRDGAWREASAYPERPGPASIDERAKFWASSINEGKFVSPGCFPAAIATRMVELGLVTPDQLRARGISV
ncbi:helix-turn-helix domain-containing protein [Roseovarius sp. D0-M9]|uniref:helix-turn-helix domain-containing protein n=1 Tax=Roseovarius sp. D0-M9 TaxID=3127117 RepID=UPI0030101703